MKNNCFEYSKKTLKKYLSCDWTRIWILVSLVFPISVILEMIILFFGHKIFCVNISDCLSWFPVNAAKDVFMTIGLTGVVFGWLVTIINKTECNVGIDDLFRFKFKGFNLLMYIFFIELVLSIFISSFLSQCKDVCILNLGTAVVISLVVGILFSIFIMLRLCRLFLFSNQNRRTEALNYLLSQIEEEKSVSDIARSSCCWHFVDEFPALLIENDKDNISRFFETLDKKKEDKITWEKKCDKFFSRLCDIIPPSLLERMGEYFYDKDDSDNVFLRMDDLFVIFLDAYNRKCEVVGDLDEKKALLNKVICSSFENEPIPKSALLIYYAIVTVTLLSPNNITIDEVEKLTSKCTLPQRQNLIIGDIADEGDVKLFEKIYEINGLEQKYFGIYKNVFCRFVDTVEREMAQQVKQNTEAAVWSN